LKNARKLIERVWGLPKRALKDSQDRKERENLEYGHREERDEKGYGGERGELSIREDKVLKISQGVPYLQTWGGEHHHSKTSKDPTGTKVRKEEERKGKRPADYIKRRKSYAHACRSRRCSRELEGQFAKDAGGSMKATEDVPGTEKRRDYVNRGEISSPGKKRGSKVLPEAVRVRKGEDPMTHDETIPVVPKKPYGISLGGKNCFCCNSPRMESPQEDSGFFRK